MLNSDFMKTVAIRKKPLRNYLISARVPKHLVVVLREYHVNVSEIINIAIRDRVLEEIRERRKK